MRHFNGTCKRCGEHYSWLASGANRLGLDTDADKTHCGPCQRYVTRWKRRWWKVSTPVRNFGWRCRYWWKYTRTGKCPPGMMECGPVTVKPMEGPVGGIFFYEYRYDQHKNETLANTENVEKWKKMLGAVDGDES